MKDIPIIFSAPMVRALLEGQKTMTRRLAWRTRINEGGVIPDGAGGQMDYIEPHEERIGPSPWQRVQSGDRLWVRETWAKDNLIDTGARYCATDDVHELRKKRSPIHMPRWASRLTLIVTAAKIEKLQAITNEDAEAEGVQCDMSARGFRDHFAALWARLHGPESWDANPEVVALTFTVHKTNIDALPKVEAA